MTLRRPVLLVLSVSLVLSGWPPTATALPGTGLDDPREVTRDVGLLEPGPDPLGDDVARVLVTPAADGTGAAVADQGARVVDEVEELGLVVVEADVADAEQLAERLEAHPSIAEAVVDHRRALFVPVLYPDDPRLIDQSDGLHLVRAESAWPITTGSSAVTVAVLDTGVDANHPDLKGRVLSGRDVMTGGTATSDPNGHGTAVAGVIAARGNNNTGIAGMTWNSRILPVRVLDQHGWGWDSDIAAGIVWAADNGAKVINLSLGGPDPSPVLEAAVAHATGKGALVVAAAGNGYDDTPMYPAAIPGVVGVGAVNLFGRLTEFSSYGPWVDVVAPGVDVMTTIPRAQGSYAKVSGTSIAAPFVAGTAALILSRRPDRTPAQVASTLRSTARDTGPPGIDAVTGWGVVDATAALGGSLGDPLFAPRYDALEPNDVPGRATPLTVGQSRTASLSPEGDEDWYRLELAEPANVIARVTPPGYSSDIEATSMEPLVALLDGQLRVAGAAVGTPENTTEMRALLPAGTTYLYVTNLNGSVPHGAYSVVVTTEAAPPLLDPEPLAGTFVAEAMELADVTGDSIDDLLVTARGAGNGLHVLPGLAGGGFGEVVTYPTGTVAALGGGIAVVDLDGDGRRDVVVATETGLEAWQQQDGRLVQIASDPALFPPATSPLLLASGDVTGDGRDELVSSGAEGTWVYRQDEGSWTRSLLTDTRYLDLEVVALDGSGAAQVVGMPAGQVVEAHRYVDGAWEGRTISVGVATSDRLHGLAVGDMDGDGRPDLVATSGTTQAAPTIRTLRQQPDGSFQPQPARSGPPDAHGVTLADIDGNGTLDAVVRSWSHLTVFPGTSTGGLQPGRWAEAPYSHEQPNVGSVLVHDVNGDGIPDVLTTTHEGLHWSSGAVGAQTGPADVWVRNVSPAPHARTVSRTPTIAIDMARQLSPSSITTSTVRLRDARTGTSLAATRSYDAAKRRITLKPDAPLIAGAVYRIDVGRVRDTDGKLHRDLVQAPFAVARDTVAPGPVTKLTPRGGFTTSQLTWTNPPDADLAYSEVRFGNNSYPSAKGGLLHHRGRGTDLTIRSADLYGGRYVTVIAYDRSGNVSSRTTTRFRWPMVGGSGGRTITHGTRVTVTGELTDAPTGAPLKGQNVDLLQRSAGSSTWKKVASATTDSDGRVSFRRTPSVTTTYRLRFNGAGAYIGREETIATVKVRSAVTANLSATTVKPGATVRMSGQVSPAKPGSKVEVQRRRADGTWATIGTATLRSDSTYRYDVTAGKAGTTRTFRVRMPADAKNLAGTSPSVRLTAQ